MKKKRFNYSTLGRPTLDFLRFVFEEYNIDENDIYPTKNLFLRDIIHKLDLPLNYLRYLPLSGVVKNTETRKNSNWVYFLTIPPTIHTANKFIADYKVYEQKRLHGKDSIKFPEEVISVNTTKIKKDTHTEIQKEVEKVKEEMTLQLIEEVSIKRFKITHPELAISFILELDMCEKTYEFSTKGLFKSLYEGKLEVSNISNMIAITELILKSLQRIKGVFDIESFKLKN